jgi:hypothetical protein
VNLVDNGYVNEAVPGFCFKRKRAKVSTCALNRTHTLGRKLSVRELGLKLNY